MTGFVTMRDGPGVDRRRGGRGMTLVELLMSLSVAGLVGLGVAGMLGALSTAVVPSGEMTEAVAARYRAARSVRPHFRNVHQILSNLPKEEDGESPAESVMLWIGDHNGNGQIDLSELRSVVWEQDPAGGGVLRIFEMPSDESVADRVIRSAWDLTQAQADLEEVDRVPDVYQCAFVKRSDEMLLIQLVVQTSAGFQSKSFPVGGKAGFKEGW